MRNGHAGQFTKAHRRTPASRTCGAVDAAQPQRLERAHALMAERGEFVAGHAARIAADIVAVLKFETDLAVDVHRTPPCGLDRPQQDGECVGLVVVGRCESARANCGDDRVLVGVALAGDEPLDRADRDALVGDAALLAPGGQRCEQAAINMCGVGAGVTGAPLRNGSTPMPPHRRQ